MRTFLLALAFYAAPALAVPTGKPVEPAPPTPPEQPRGEPGTTQPGTATPGTTQPGATTPTAKLNDAQILNVLMDANDAEIAEGSLAVARGTNADVKAFGKRMIDEHTASNKKLDELANKLKLKREASDLSRTMQADAKKEQGSLNSLQGAAFDRSYADSQVRDHRELLTRIDSVLMTQVTNAEVRSALTELRPKVADHLQAAEKLQQTFQTQPGTK